ncbi:MAG: Guanylate kinase [candidate division WS6 bacterium OLB20]|uniref:Guanylate kinase n=1 Tax=candidate division WS6 bacterium OLB20 TaxID=1617426 RepID=A0A136M0A6_9BACT|nr:MAG: Guanylate kinase [candidate division WS6 bacterium OLB20]
MTEADQKRKEMENNSDIRIVAVGTSGVGKSYLEQTLKRELGFVPVPKITDRAARESEIGSTDIVFVSPKEFTEQKAGGEFVFTLDYKGQQYGWRKDDFDAITASGQHPTMAITLESLPALLETDPRFVPVFLQITEAQLPMLEQRMQDRGEDEAQIQKRLELARSEIERFNTPEYEQLVTDHGGRVFVVESDDTIPGQVIPWIKERLGLE